ncbi:hypothetical protein M2152_001817 [Microbacteriaceae bacterium SG_E_30_P1]|uniref:Uncharacterized protein n=1 Tax=Antiquaquibacter oligotrophicus TaxID=2880260 RepID=A0ABT6KNQ0_9MICO|nr:hypothetical protein [Antiquaquibacter oligotrophicus]MDH6181635.1 hypothetical protein [Antiquaquibacter oligotrophicus]UDF12681.1 hypothetical protein LH407_11020 [Antiquaquibacter oligotrophicus]
MQTRRSSEGDLDYNFYDVDLQPALHSVLLDYLKDVDGSTVDALSFAVSGDVRPRAQRALDFISRDGPPGRSGGTC